MANFPEEAEPQSPINGSESMLAAKPAASGATMIYITPAQLKQYIQETAAQIIAKIGVLPISSMPAQRMSQNQFTQPVVNNVKGDIEHNMTWFNAAVKAVGATEGWGSGAPANPLAAPVVTLGSRTENSIGFSWPAVQNAASYNIYKNDVLLTNVTTLSYTSSGLTASTSYGHTVRAVPASGSGYSISQASNTLTASTTAAIGLPTPTAPTVVFNSSARTLSATHSTYPNGLERRYNAGAWENAADTAAVYVGTDAVAANVYEWRVKAVSGTNLAGTPAGNTAIAAQGGGSQGIPVDDEWIELSSTTRSGNKLTAVDGSSRSRTNISIVVGQVGYFECVPNGGALLLSTNPTSLDGFNESMLLFNHNEVNNKVQAYIAGDILNQETNGGIAVGSRVICDLSASQIIFSYVPTGGQKTPWATVTIPNGLVGTRLYLKSFMSEGQTQTNILQGGFA